MLIQDSPRRETSSTGKGLFQSLNPSKVCFSDYIRLILAFVIEGYFHLDRSKKLR